MDKDGVVETEGVVVDYAKACLLTELASIEGFTNLMLDEYKTCLIEKLTKAVKGE